ncbi:hypothetical protein [Agromyces italicus]|uniref:hypothetical protein n=1 Tax=Agromyces italicus TaxID=279572 RepID=UPI001FDFD3F9|nr:hypothetical protein [Agromyces italicus]
MTVVGLVDAVGDDEGAASDDTEDLEVELWLEIPRDFGTSDFGTSDLGTRDLGTRDLGT